MNITAKQLYEYYEKLKNPKYVIGDWLICNDKIYLKYKNKLLINNFISIIDDDTKNEKIIIFEDKKLYYAVRYNDKFICIKPSSTEYGLTLGDYHLIAINKNFAYLDLDTKDTKSYQLNSAKEICEMMNWKLGRQAKEYLDYFK
jgi:hypothetical protein